VDKQITLDSKHIYKQTDGLRDTQPAGVKILSLVLQTEAQVLTISDYVRVKFIKNITAELMKYFQAPI